MKRDSSIDIAKIIASIFVFYIHYINRLGFTELPINDGNFLLVSSLYSIFMTCIPLFFMSTGIVLRNRKDNAKHYIKILPFLLLTVILLFLGTYLTQVVIHKHFDLEKLINFILDTPYYITFYILIYFLAPFLNDGAKNLSLRQIYILILVMSAAPYINLIEKVNLKTFTTTLYPIVYYAIGICLYNNKEKIIEKSNIIFSLIKIALFAIANTYTSIWFTENGVVMGLTRSNYSIFVALIAIEIYKILLKVNVKNNIASKVLGHIAGRSYYFYILGIIFSDHITKNFYPISNNMMEALVQSPIHLLISFGVSYLLSLIVDLFIYILGLPIKLIKKKNRKTIEV